MLASKTGKKKFSAAGAFLSYDYMQEACLAGIWKCPVRRPSTNELSQQRPTWRISGVLLLLVWPDSLIPSEASRLDLMPRSAPLSQRRARVIATKTAG